MTIYVQHSHPSTSAFKNSLNVPNRTYDVSGTLLVVRKGLTGVFDQHRRRHSQDAEDITNDENLAPFDKIFLLGASVVNPMLTKTDCVGIYGVCISSGYGLHYFFFLTNQRSPGNR